jgi:hypothetical protein
MGGWVTIHSQGGQLGQIFINIPLEGVKVEDVPYSDHKVVVAS